MANGVLQDIQTKVRRITRSPGEDLLTTAQLNEYINTFVLYDFPEHLRLFNLKTILEFWTSPNVAEYATNTTDPNNPLYQFVQKYISIHPPVYVAGVQVALSQSREQFYTTWPQNNFIAQIASGDGSTLAYSGVLSSFPVLPGDVTFSSVTSNNDALTLIDYPISSEIGAIGIPGVPQTLPSPYGQINYLTGAYTINFFSLGAPGAGKPIYSQIWQYNPGLPTAMLFYDGVMTFRPVPDKVYKVSIEAYIRPTELLQADATTVGPKLQEWWQYIAWGAAKKIFEDRMDMDSVALMMPEFKKQEELILRRTVVQQSNQRSWTIYVANNSPGSWGYNFFNNYGGGS